MMGFNKGNTGHRHTWLLASTAVALAMTAAPAHAQNIGGAADANTLEEILVTGSYVRRSVSSPSPVTVLSMEELSHTPRTSLGEFFHADPAFNGSEVFTSFGTGLGSSASASINLRGLGPRGTLVLLNGRRGVYNAQPTRDGVTTFDINSLLPAIAIERVEILKDGASALYGTDAVAGVVNFLTRDNFNGLELNGSWQKTDTGGQDERLIGGIFGAGDDRGHVMLAMEYLERDEFNFLDFQDVADFAAVNGSFANNSTPGAFRLIPGETYGALVPAGPGANNRLVRDPDCGDPSIAEGIRAGIPGFLGAETNNNQVCLAASYLGRGAIAQVDRVNAFSKAEYKLSESINVGMEVGFTRAHLERTGGYGYRQPEFLVPADHPANPFGGGVLYRGSVDGPAAGRGNESVSKIDNETWRVALLADGAITDDGRWRWNTNFTWSRNESTATRTDAVTERMENALLGLGGVNCNTATGVPGAGNCMYFNPFATRYTAQPGDPEYNDPALMDYIRPLSSTFAHSKLITYTAVVSGELFDLPGGPLGLALGYEYRKDSMNLTYDPITLAGGFSFVGVEVPFDAARDVNGGFVELVAPVMDQLEIQLAGRYEDYGSGVSQFVPKVGALWTPTDTVFVRGTFGKSFRAPDLLPTYGTNAGVTEQVTVPGVFTGNPYAVTYPNLNLKPEQADVYTFGTTWDATDTITVSLDWWRFDFSNITGQESAQLVVQEYADTGANADRLFFNDFGELEEVHLVFDNFAALKARGLDFSFSWLFGLGDMGNLTFDARGTWTMTYKYQLRDDLPVQDGLGRVNNGLGIVSPMPELKANVALSWDKDGHFARTTLRYIKGMLSNTLADDDPLQTDKAYYQVDLFYSYTWEMEGGPLSVRLAMNNALDERPPLLTGLQPAIPGVYDIRGRNFSIGLSKTF